MTPTPSVDANAIAAKPSMTDLTSSWSAPRPSPSDSEPRLDNGPTQNTREEVTAPFGIEHPVLAWGLGISRVAMLKLGLRDLRQLYRSDVEWIRETPTYGGRR